MIPEERAFPSFAWGVCRGLYVAALSDINVFLLVVAAASLGGGPRRRGVGKALMFYVAMRQTNDYARVFASKLDRIAALKDV